MQFCYIWREKNSRTFLLFASCNVIFFLFFFKFKWFFLTGSLRFEEKMVILSLFVHNSFFFNMQLFLSYQQNISFLLNMRKIRPATSPWCASDKVNVGGNWLKMHKCVHLWDVVTPRRKIVQISFFLVCREKFIFYNSYYKIYEKYFFSQYNAIQIVQFFLKT